MEYNNVSEMESAKSKIENYQNAKMGFVSPEQRKADQEKNENRLTIKFEKEKFTGTHSTDVTRALEFAQKIANKLGKVFCDLAGAIIVPGSHGEPSLILYFKDVPARDDRIKGIVQLKDKLNGTKNANYSPSAQSLYNMTSMYKSNRVYDLTDDAKDGLERFLTKDGNGNINWNQKISETTSTGMVGGEILVKVQGFNLIEFVKAIYGYKYTTEINGAKVVNIIDYTISLISPVNTPYGVNTYNSANNVLTDYALSISAIDRTELNKVAKIFGQPTSYGATPMCIPQE